MTSFLKIATPHRDILEGKFSLDTYAADLWEVHQKRAISEYKDPEVFFSKTYITKGLSELINVAEERLKGKGGDPIIQLQTPFGGGKTHSLITLYHKAKQWGAKVVVLDGTAFDPKDTLLWEEIERQLTGKVEKLKGTNSPGKEKLRNLLSQHSPVLILLDEVLEYSTKALTRKIGNTNLSSQVLAFLQELTQTVSMLGNCLLVLTLPSSHLEHYGEESEKLFQQLQKISGRMEKIYQPVNDEEISLVVKRRLFSEIDEKKGKRSIDKFLDYAEKEEILPQGVEKSEYREMFIRSFPFQPEVIEILYHRWGSFPNFQRTRGVLRLLSLVVHSLLNKNVPFIRLSDFDLSDSKIRAEFVKQIGNEYNGVISADITSYNSGAKKVDENLGSSNIPYSFGTKVATTIFLYSFSGGAEKGVSLKEIKLSTAEIGIPSSIIAEAVSQLRERLFFLQTDDGRYYFSNQPNLNRIHLRKMENVEDEEIKMEERDLLNKKINNDYFKPFIWPKNSKDIPDTKEYKLIVMKTCDREKMEEIVENYGKQPRVFRNTLIFLCPDEGERINFENALRKKIAWEKIEKEEMHSLSEQQQEEVKENLEKSTEEAEERLRIFYRKIFLPAKENFKEIDLGLPTYGTRITINREIYERLRSEEEILEKIAPLVIKEKYLGKKEWVETKNILETFYKTSGEIKIVNEEILKESIREGVKQGLFGLGEKEEDEIKPRYFKDECSPMLCEGEVLISEKVCEKEEEEKKVEFGKDEEIMTSKKVIGEREEGKVVEEGYKEILLKFNLPSGRMSDIMKVINLLRSKFEEIEIKMELTAKNGKISKSEYEDKIKETFSQLGITAEEEKK